MLGNNMFFGLITFITALTISGVAIYYSVAGLAAIFAAAVIPIIVMGVALEVGKLVTAVWLHRNWSRAVWWMKTYLAVAVFVLMFITSMGIFGFLSKAHIEQTSLSQEQVALIETLDDKETRSQAKIDRWRGELDRLLKGEDVRVDNLIDKEQEGLDKIYDRIKGEKDAVRKDAKFEIEQQQTRIKQAQDRRDAEIAAAEKKFEGTLGGSKQYEEAVTKAKNNELSVASRAQKEILAINTKLDEDLAKIDAKYAGDIKAINDRIQDLRNQANTKTVDIEGRITELEGFIESEQKIIDDVNEEKFGYEKEYRKLEAEVGPIKYIAEFIYGEQADQNLLEAAVRWVIIIIIFVFDPLAVLLLIASQYTFNWYREEKGLNGPGGGSTPGKPSDPDPKESFEEYEKTRAEKIEANIPPEIEQPQEKSVSQLLEEGFKEEQKQREEEAEEQEEEKTAEEKEDLKVAEEIEEAMKGEGDDLDKWNNWVEAANKEAEKETQGQLKDSHPLKELEKEMPDTKNRIFYSEELQKKRNNETKSYITKVSNKQVRLKTKDE
jgi:hypothetical protein